MITAKLKHLRTSPRKVRLVVDLIRGLDVIVAENQLKFLPKRSAEPVLILLKSAIANALNDFNAVKENLFISKITVDQGPTLKRWMPRAMGRATPIMKRTSHLTIELESKEPLLKEKEVKKEKELDVEKKDVDSLKEKSKPIEKEEDKSSVNHKSIVPEKPYLTPSQSKKKLFSRQTFGNVKKQFRRKSI